jgi:hypothetical protein
MVVGTVGEEIQKEMAEDLTLAEEGFEGVD